MGFTTGWKTNAAAMAATIACHAAASAQDIGPGSTLNPMAAVQKSSLSSFIEHPLFDPSRSLPQPVLIAEEPPPPPVVPEAPPSLRVVGIVQGHHEVFAVVSRSDANKVETIRTGDHLGIWHVDVRETDVVLSSKTASARYELFSNERNTK